MSVKPLNPLSPEQLARLEAQAFPFMPAGTFVTAKKWEQIRAVRLERTIDALTPKEIDRAIYLLKRRKKSRPKKLKGGQTKWDSKRLRILCETERALIDNGLSKAAARDWLAGQYEVEVKHITKKLKEASKIP